MRMSYSEIKQLPVRYRMWFIERLNTHFKNMNTNNEKQTAENNAENLGKFEDQMLKRLAK